MFFFLEKIKKMNEELALHKCVRLNEKKMEIYAARTGDLARSFYNRNCGMYRTLRHQRWMDADLYFFRFQAKRTGVIDRPECIEIKKWLQE